MLQQLPHWAWGTVAKVPLPLETLLKQHNSDAAMAGDSTWSLATNRGLSFCLTMTLDWAV